MAKDNELPRFRPLSDLADEAGTHPSSIQKYLARGVIKPDAYITRGRDEHPIFLRERFPALVRSIVEYREKLLAQLV